MAAAAQDEDVNNVSTAELVENNNNNNDTENDAKSNTSSKRLVQPIVRHVIKTPTRACSVATFGNSLYVARHRSDFVDVYNFSAVERAASDSRTDDSAPDIDVVDRIRVRDLGQWPMGLAVCTSYRCLYVTSYDTDMLFRIELNSTTRPQGVSRETNRCVMRRHVGAGPVGISVMKDGGHVLVSCTEASLLQEYSSFGQLLREIRLHFDDVITPEVDQSICPWNAVQIECGSETQFVVTDVGPSCERGAIYVVDESGFVVCQYGQCVQPTVNFPAGLTVVPENAKRHDKSDEKRPQDPDVTVASVLVADRDNCRLLILEPSGRVLRELTVPLMAEGCRQFPVGVHFYEALSTDVSTDGSKTAGCCCLRLIVTTFDCCVLVLDCSMDLCPCQ